MQKKVALITGAARGIGYGIATCLARQGTKIIIADMNGQAARKSARQLAADTGVETLGLACDICDRTQVATMVRKAVKRFGRIDILVNNAGICPFVDIMEMSEEMFKKTMDVNLTGAFPLHDFNGRVIERKSSAMGGPCGEDFDWTKLEKFA